MREACAEVFERWIAAGVERFVAGGLSEQRARELAIVDVRGARGRVRARARASASTEALAGRREMATASAVERALAEAS